MIDTRDGGRRYQTAAFLLGFSISGFFDGILLHQILQWHHLLQAVQNGVLRDMRWQLAADGLFHLLMYALLLISLWMLWSARRRAGDLPGKRTLAIAGIGFASWHVVDAVFSHWLLGIHRIRMDSPNPLMWDLVWLAAFGLLPLALGIVMLRPGGGSGGGRAVAAVLAAVTVAMAALAALPPRNATTVMVVLRPGADLNRTLDEIRRLKGGVLWASQNGRVWTFRLGQGQHPGSLYSAGALLVTASPAALGCMAWTKASTL